MESLTPVVNYILEGEFPKEFTTGQRRKLMKQASTFLWLEGALYQKGKDLVCRRVPSTNEIPKILKGLHEEACGGHFSHELTLKKVLLAGYVWPSMHADVQHWCRSCHNCQVNGNKRLLYGPRQAVIANGPFEKWGIDAMGPLPRTANGKLYILVAIDYMTRWVEAQSVAKVNEKTVSKFVYTHICCRFGTPLEIVSDNGPGFRRGLLTEVCEVLKISHRHSTPYYPQSNGLVEKANGIIAGIIRKMVESKPKRWDNFLDGAIWAYRTTYRDATQFTPFHLVYGQEALQPIELNIPTIKLTGRQEQSNDEAWIDRLLNLVELEWKREAAYHCYEKKALQLKDKLNEGIKDKEIKEKSLVLRYNNALDNRFDAKFERRWEGPFIVKKAFTGGYYQLMDLNGKEHPRKVNGYRLKPYLSRILPAVFETKQVSKKTKKGVHAPTLSRLCDANLKFEQDACFLDQADAEENSQVVKEKCEVIDCNQSSIEVTQSMEEAATTFIDPCMPMHESLLIGLGTNAYDFTFWQEEKGYDFGSSYLDGLSSDMQSVNAITNCICYGDSMECKIDAIFALHVEFYDEEVQRHLSKPIQINEQKPIQDVFQEVFIAHSSKSGQDVSLVMEDTKFMDLLDDALEGFLFSSTTCSSQHSEVCVLKPCTDEEDSKLMQMLDESLEDYRPLLCQDAIPRKVINAMEPTENLELLPYDPVGVQDYLQVYGPALLFDPHGATYFTQEGSYDFDK
ncbi:hypothetical protein L7F22_028205 [Adiantum nelumboides]|nr:hypothetical protein [Adiantum nelumboides]